MSFFVKYRQWNCRELIQEGKMQTIQNATVTIKEAWAYQPPVIHAWFVASSAALMVMLAVFCAA